MDPFSKALNSWRKKLINIVLTAKNYRILDEQLGELMKKSWLWWEFKYREKLPKKYTDYNPVDILITDSEGNHLHLTIDKNNQQNPLTIKTNTM